MQMYAFFIAAGLVAPAASAQPQTVAGTTQTPVEKLVCKKITETGSLVKRHKVCLTRAQWDRSQENHRQYGEQMADRMRTRPGGF